MFRFQHIEYLIALCGVPFLAALYFLVLRWKRKTAVKIGDPLLVKQVTGNFSTRKFNIKFLLILIAFVITVFALANPRYPRGSEKITRDGIDVMIALDVSKSMLAQDIKPSRLERAKQLLGRLIDQLGNDRIGLVIFAGKAYLQMPLTSDHSAAKMYLSAASPDVVPTQGTVIGEALKTCYASFNAKEKRYKAVILISDGEDHDETALDVAGKMAEEGVNIHTIGIGSPGGAPIFDEATNEMKKDNEGNTVISKLNEKELQDIAAKGNGMYQLFSNTDEVVTKLQAQINSMDQRAVTEDSLVNYQNYFTWFLAVALLLLVLEIFITERKKEVKPLFAKAVVKQTVAALLVIVIATIPLRGLAQNENEMIKKGNEAYKNKHYTEATEHYQKAAEKNNSNPVTQYNLGNALYKSDKVEDAVKAYDNALTNQPVAADKEKIFYNKGVVLQKNKKLQECIGAYKNALKLSPQDEDARQNLQKALQQLKQQQQQNKPKNDKNKQQPKDDPKQNKDQQKPKDKNNQPGQPKPQPSKLTKQEAEDKLKALLEEEKNLQDKLRRVNAASPNKPEKDW